MEKNFKLIIIFLSISLSIFLFNCQKAVEKERISIGKIVDVNVVPTSFNEMIKTQVKTEKMFLVIGRCSSIPLQEDAFIVIFSDGRKFFTWESSNYMYQILLEKSQCQL